ncbi:flagellar assembly protein FliH [Peribacillus sp. SCS-155]|uniref:flagellar assembly protein FliH n=1 Tax=Peribacillus sedimenti TaxID=3115297 RepID=UPI003906C7A6
MSRIIKSSLANADDNEKKTIRIRPFSQMHNADLGHLPAIHQNILEEASAKAQEILAQAREQAEQILSNIAMEKQHWEESGRQEMYEQAREQGFAEGWNTGSQKGYDEMTAHISEAREIVGAAKADYQKYIEVSEKTILELGIKVSQRILGKQLEVSEEAFLSLVRQAIREARDHREIQLHISPVHYRFILAQKEELLSVFPKDTDFYIYPDADLSEGSCIIESSHGRIDASVDSQLDHIKQKLLELLEGE